MVRIGRGLTAFQESSTQFEPFHGVPSPAGFQTDLMVAGYTSDPLGSVGNSTNRFSNAVFYNSNPINGFQINATVGTKEASAGSVAITGRGTVANPQYRAGSDASANPYSVSATYSGAAGSVMLAAERNAVESRLFSIAGYVMATPDLKLMATRVQQDRGHTFFNSEDARSWVVGANYKMGSSKILAGYGRKKQGALNQGHAVDQANVDRLRIQPVATHLSVCRCVQQERPDHSVEHEYLCTGRQSRFLMQARK